MRIDNLRQIFDSKVSPMIKKLEDTKMAIVEDIYDELRKLKLDKKVSVKDNTLEFYFVPIMDNKKSSYRYYIAPSLNLEDLFVPYED